MASNIFLTQKLLPVMREISWWVRCLQQDKTPTHWACETIREIHVNFVRHVLYDPNSPDL